MRGAYKVLALLAVMALLPACSGDSFSSGAATGTPGEGGGGTAPGCEENPTAEGCVVNANYVSLRLSQQQIKSDGSDSTTITATVLDTDRAAIKDAQVHFSTTAGKLNSSVVFTDENGEAKVKFSSDSADPSNQTANITATVTGVGTAVIPVEIIGTTLEVTVDSTSLQIPASVTSVSQAIKIVAKDAGGQYIYGARLTFSVGVSGTVSAALSATQATTNTRGEVNLTLTASGSGTATFVVTGLGTSQSQAFTVANIVADNPFRITSPTTDPSAIVSGDPVAANRQVQITVAAQGVATVRFSSTIGRWTTSLASYQDVAVSGGVASATLEALAGNHGFATVVVSDANNPSTYDSMTVVMSPPSTAAAQIMLQSDVKVLAPSNSTTQYSTTIRAKVVTDDASGNYPIYNVPVILTLANTTGGGESLSTAFATTDLNGYVTAKFTSGITPTGQQGVQITATAAGFPAVTDSMTIEIGGLAGSVALGTPRLIDQIDENKSINIYNMSALVADGTGAGVAGAQVSLHYWPFTYSTGTYHDVDCSADVEEWVAFVTATFPNEDRDEDLILDPGEDINGDGELTPPNSTAGVGPSMVTTLADGTAPFNYTYLKDYAVWTQVRARGSVRVLGTEATTSKIFTPLAVKAEIVQGLWSPSPYLLVLEAQDTGGDAMYPGTTRPWEAPVLDDNGDTLSPVGMFNAVTRRLVIPGGTYVPGDVVYIDVLIQGSCTDNYAAFTVVVKII
jgi:hypothetical protein